MKNGEFLTVNKGDFLGISVSREISPNERYILEEYEDAPEPISFLDKDGNVLYQNRFYRTNVLSLEIEKDLNEKENKEGFLISKDGNVRFSDNSYKPVLIKDINLKCGLIQRILTDITDLDYLANHDGMTRLYNQGFFNTELARLDASGRQLPLSIIAIDIDGLKQINDTLGHLQGDELIKTMASLLKLSFRPEDILCRLGGDEFSVILPKVSYGQTQDIIERLTINRDNFAPSLSFSVGMATKTDISQSMVDVLQEADSMMYRNKNQKKNTRVNISIIE